MTCRGDKVVEKLNCSNVMELANEVKEYLNTEKKKYTARPFNRFTPENSVWWIIPGSDWPAYKYGKYMFRRDKNIIYVGLNIEKGYGKKLSGMVSNNAIMTDEWIWHDFMESACQGELDKTIEILDQKTASDVHILMGFGEFNKVDEESDYYADVYPNNITYILKQDTIKVQNKERQMKPDIFEELKQAESFQEAFKIMSKIEGLSYFWVDFFVGVSFKISNNGEPDIFKLDNQVLSVLKKWVKGAS